MRNHRRFYGPNKVWGEDMLLDDLDLVCHSQAVALTYTEAFALSKSAFEDVGGRFPIPMAKVSINECMQIHFLAIPYTSLSPPPPRFPNYPPGRQANA